MNPRSITLVTAIGLTALSAVYSESTLKDYSEVEKKHPTMEPRKDSETGFVVGGKNETALIRGLTEINGIEIPDLEKSMRPKGLSNAGFLGKDEGLLDVMAADNDWVLGAGLTHQEIARHLYTLYRISLMVSEPLKESDVFVYRGVRFTTIFQRSDGYQHSPFKDGTKTSADVFLKNVDNGKTLKYSPLVPLMVERYGFYEGHGTSFRVDPKETVEVLTFLAPKEAEAQRGGADQPAASSESKVEGDDAHAENPRDSKVLFLHLFSNRYDINSMGKLPPPPRDWQCIATVSMVSGYPFYFDIPCHYEPQMRIEGTIVRTGKRADPNFTIFVADVGPAYRHIQKTAIDLGTLHEFGDSGFKFSISASKKPPQIGAKD